MIEKNMHNFMMYQGVKDKIATAITTLGLSECKHYEEISEKTFEEIKIISKAYGIAITNGYTEDLVMGNTDNYSTLNFLMDIVVIQSLRVSAARYGVMTDLDLNEKDEDDDDNDQG
jgi:hypothetical protein